MLSGKSDFYKTNNMNGLYQLLKQIEERPTFYLSRYSIFDLQSFYYGYCFAKLEFNLPETAEEKEFEEFLEWIRSLFEENYGITTTQSWAMLILFHSADERDALERFFQLFETFLEIKRSGSTELSIAIPFEIGTVVRASCSRGRDARTTAFPKSFRIAIYWMKH